MGKALLVIDMQNDYFKEGSFPLWNTEQTLENVESAIALARKNGVPVVHIQHIADGSQGIAPFFNEGTGGAEIHPRIAQAAPDSPVVIKSFADGFEKTELAEVLSGLDVDELVLCGMMTQNCVTHTAISQAAAEYKVGVAVDCCTTVDEMLHNIALHAISTRVSLAPASALL